LFEIKKNYVQKKFSAIQTRLPGTINMVSVFSQNRRYRIFQKWIQKVKV